MNVYGYWQYNCSSPIKNGLEIKKGDIISTLGKDGDILRVLFRGKIEALDINLFRPEKKKFIRPIRGHKPSRCKTKDPKCERCSVWRKKRETTVE